MSEREGKKRLEDEENLYSTIPIWLRAKFSRF